METKVIYGTELAAKIKERISLKIDKLTSNGRRVPKLVVIQVGDNPASTTYVKNKVKACEEVCINSEVIKLGEGTSELMLKTFIKIMNRDHMVDGILVQMPLPKHLDEKNVAMMVDPDKDVDGLNYTNDGR